MRATPRRREVLLGFAFLACLFLTRAAFADVTVTFEKPKVWRESMAETWVLLDRRGTVVCELPCSAPVPRDSGYVLEGEGISGITGRSIGPPLRLVIPEALGVAGSARPASDLSPGTHVVARVHPTRGSPNGAIALAIASGVALVTGAATVADAVSSCSGGGCRVAMVSGFALGGVGVLGEVIAIALGVYSQRPGVDLREDTATGPRESRASQARVTLSPFGVVGVF